MTSDAGQKIANNVFWLSFQEVFARLSGFLLVMLLARILSTTDFGSLNICLAVMSMLTLLVRVGTGSRATRLTARETRNILELHSAIIGLRLAAAAVIIVLTLVFARPLSEFLSVSPYLLVFSSALLLRPTLTVAWAFRGIDDMKPIAWATIGERTIVLVGVILLLSRQEVGADAVLFLEVLAGLAVVVYLRWKLYRFLDAALPFRPHPSGWGDMLKESWPISLAALIGSFYRYGDLILLGVLSNSTATALFLIPQKIALTLLVLPILIGRASFPSMSRTVHINSNAAAALQAQLLRLTLLLLLPAGALVGFYSQEMLKLLFGSDYGGEGNTLIILLLSMPFFAFATFQEQLLLAVPRPRAVMICRVMASGAHLLTSVTLIPLYGTVGAATGCLVGQALFAILAAATWRQKHGRLPLDYRCLAPVLGSVLLLLGLYYCADPLGDWQALVVAVIVYLVVIFSLGGISWREMKQGVDLLRFRFRGSTGSL